MKRRKFYFCLTTFATIDKCSINIFHVFHNGVKMGKQNFLQVTIFFITTSYIGDTSFLEGSISKEGIIHENNFVKLILVKSEFNFNMKKRSYIWIQSSKNELDS